MRVHPFERLSPTRFRTVYAVAWIAMLAIEVLLVVLGAGYADIPDASGKTYNVFAFELNGTPAGLAHMFATWGETGRRAVLYQTLGDYLFLVAYSCLIAACIVAVMSAGPPGRWTTVGRALAWGQWLAALLDATENSALIWCLLKAPATPFPQIAAVCATVKFALVIAGVVYIFAALPRAFRPADGQATRTG